MSIHYMNAVWRDQYFTNSDKTKLLVALALADCSDDNGQSFPSIDYIARKARSTTRCAQMACREMERDGKLEILIGMGRNGTNLYVLKAGGETISGVKCVGKGIGKGIGSPFHPNHKEPLEPQGTVTPSSAKAEEREALLRDFNLFWSAYPKKKSKAKAIKAWSAHKPPIGTVLEKVSQFRRSHDWMKDGGQFIPYPASWLNATGWEDELKIDLSTPQSSPQEKKLTQVERYGIYAQAVDARKENPMDMGEWFRAGEPKE